VAGLKVVTVVGARPQFIKAAAVSPRLRQVATEVLVHTGQHYDRELSGVFFEELHLPPPEVTLGVGSGSHGEQTGEMLKRLDPLLRAERPDWVLVYGDTNSTLAGALAAAKLGIPVAHVEAGLRSYNRAMPEEINRVVTDHLATRLYCPTAYARDNLAREGIHRGVVVTGDVMDETVHLVRDRPEVLRELGVTAGQYWLATVHRQENTDDPVRLDGILQALGTLPGTVVWPMHPRARERIVRFGLTARLQGMRVTEPQGYAASLTLIRHARAVLTDSGGVQREAAALGVPCYILRDETEWVDLVEAGQAVLVGTDPAVIRAAVGEERARGIPKNPVGQPSQRIVEDLVQGQEG
jgi:UDP-GlcNAc3NAcA epimerase